MTYQDFYILLRKNRMASHVWEYVLNLIEEELKNIDQDDKDGYLKLFAIYFSLIDEGNTCMSLLANDLKKKWTERVDASDISLSEAKNYDKEEFLSIRKESEQAIDTYLGKINEVNLPQIIGDKKIFEVEDNWLYLKKYNAARKGIVKNADRIFSYKAGVTSTFDYRMAVKENFRLKEGQEKAAIEGVGYNLVITGGPGTGKTTSILILLINLLLIDEKQDIYLLALSGKAASRMKESIINGLGDICDDFKQAHPSMIHKIENLEESTINRLLSYDRQTGGFAYNKDHQISGNPIFVIDEASMIDICLFNSLLNAIPDESRVFIMGDKNQLPSVESGAVFSDLLSKYKDNVIELDESIRFGEDTKIFELADAINKGTDLPVLKDDWGDYRSFKIEEKDKSKPIFYYSDTSEGTKEGDIIKHIVEAWGKEYYKGLQKAATDVSDSLEKDNLDSFESIIRSTERGRILSAENGGTRGIKSINKIIDDCVIDKSELTSIIGCYPGQLMMVTKNNKSLDLYNGDSGIIVTFKDDDTLYFMVKKSTNLVQKEGKKNDEIFKLGSFIFYPFRMIARSDIELSYAITIHKSQGSDYENILIFLPKKKGHPLLNRQIIYTAITRTKGNTYIVSNQERLEEARDRIIVRDTNVR